MRVSSCTAPSASLPRVAIIGVSGYGRVHVQLLRECLARGEIRLTAAAIINPEEEHHIVEEFRRHGCTIYSSYEELFAREQGRIDLCLIPTGIHWHAPMTLAALRAGANVLVEKPLAATVADAEAVARAERETGCFAAVGFQDYYEASTQWLKAKIHSGAIGTLQSLRFLGIWPRPRSYYLRNNWAGRLYAGGLPVMDSPLNNAFGHFAMLGLYLAGAERDSAATVQVERAQLYRARKIESFDTAVVQMRTGAATLWFGATHASLPQREPEITLIGSDGIAVWNYESEIRIMRQDGQNEHYKVNDTTSARRDMMAAVLRKLRDPKVPVCSPALALQHTAFIEQVHISGPVQDFASEAIEWTQGEAADSVPVVRGLDAALRIAYEKGAALEFGP